MKNNFMSVNLYDEALLEKFNLSLVQNVNSIRTVKYYSEILAISTKKLNYITKKYFGKTAKVYIEERIIENSKKLLSDTPDTVKQISYTLGFTDPTNFNKFFKKHTSKTPLMFRQQFNKGTF